MDKSVAAFIEGFSMAVIVFLIVVGVLCLSALILILILGVLAFSLILAPFAMIGAVIKYFWPRDKGLNISL